MTKISVYQEFLQDTSGRTKVDRVRLRRHRNFRIYVRQHVNGKYRTRPCNKHSFTIPSKLLSNCKYLDVK